MSSTTEQEVLDLYRQGVPYHQLNQMYPDLDLKHNFLRIIGASCWQQYHQDHALILRDLRNNSGFTTALKKKVKQQAGNRCEICGSTTSLIVHHIRMFSKGGTNDMDNLMAICRKCHRAIHNHAINCKCRSAQQQLSRWYDRTGPDDINDALTRSYAYKLIIRQKETERNETNATSTHQ